MIYEMRLKRIKDTLQYPLLYQSHDSPTKRGSQCEGQTGHKLALVLRLGKDPTCQQKAPNRSNKTDTRGKRPDTFHSDPEAADLFLYR
jgi:hypothetical protein